MMLAALLPLAWALAGLVVVARFTAPSRPVTADQTRIDVTGSDDLRPAA